MEIWKLRTNEIKILKTLLNIFIKIILYQLKRISLNILKFDRFYYYLDFKQSKGRLVRKSCSLLDIKIGWIVKQSQESKK